MNKILTLKNLKTVTITPSSPFNFDATFHKPDHFPSGDNAWESGKKWQTFLWQGQRIGLKFKNKGSVEKPLINLSIYSEKVLTEEFISSLTEEIRYRYNLDLDLQDFYSRFERDKDLGPIIKKWRGMRPAHSGSLYEYLIIGIILQNATVRRSIQMFDVLLRNYGGVLQFDGKEFLCLWEPGSLKEASEENLRALKVGYRAKAIKKIDEAFYSGLIDERELRDKDMETQTKELLKLYGIGPATVWYLLFDVFHHYDFFNHISPWEQKIYSRIFFGQDTDNPTPVKDLMNHFEKFKPYQQLAVHYIWEDLWWKRKNEHIPWLEKEIRI